MDLNAAMNQFDLVEVNLRRLEVVWNRMSAMVPTGIVFSSDSESARAYAELSRAFDDIANGIPAIEGWTIDARPMEWNEIAQNRLDANEVDVIELHVDVAERIVEPGNAIAEYRFKFDRAKRALVRDRVRELIAEVDAAAAQLASRFERDGTDVSGDESWQSMVAAIAEIERLVGSSVERLGRWSGLSRHIAFAKGVDARDIAEFDWPSVLEDVERALYGETEPVPVDVEDLATLVESKPSGRVTTELSWTSLEDESFERLVFNLISDASGYENAKWLTKTNAPDHGRDLSVDRVVNDQLSGVTRLRVIIQCKHWQSRSVRDADISGAIVSMAHWEPPVVDVMIVATSGRFTSDAISWVEKRNNKGVKPFVELWPDSHIESLLASRPYLVEEFGLRK